jgi:YVTN family beta-propeller protein
VRPSLAILTPLITVTGVLALGPADADARRRKPRPRQIGYAVTLGGNTFRIWGAGRTGVMPKGVSVSPDGKRIYVTNFGRKDRHNLDVYDARTFRRLRTVSFRGNTIESVVSADSKTIYVSNYYGYKIQALDIKTFKPRWSTRTGHFPKMMALSANGKWLYVSSWESATVSKLDAATGKIQATSKVGRHPRGVSVSPDGKILYVAICGGRHVYLLDTARMKIVHKIRTGRLPRHTALTRDGKRLYVSIIGGSMLQVIDTAKRKVIKTVWVAKGPRSIALSADERFVYVAAYAGHALTIVDTKTFKKKILRLDIVKASGVAVHPTTGFIYVTGWCTKDLWAIERIRPGSKPRALGKGLRRGRVYRDPKTASRLDCPLPRDMYRRRR